MKDGKRALGIIWGWFSPSGIAAIKSLEKEGLLEVAAWFGHAEECSHHINDFVYKLKFLDPAYSGDCSHITSSVLDAFPIFMDMYSRVSLSSGKPVQELKHIFHIYVDYFLHLIVGNKVDVVILSGPPVFGPDYILYRVAKALKIKVIITYQSFFPNRFFYVKSLDDFGIFNDVSSEQDTRRISLPKGFRKDYIYMKNIKPVRHHCRSSLVADLLQLANSRKRKPMSLSGVFQKYQACCEFRRFQSKTEVKHVNLDVPFVYFPLHLQPELTTSALGGEFADQLSAIERLRVLIPDSWEIYVKENPKQKYRQRGMYFYTRLARIPGTTLLSRNIDTYSLIEKAKFTAVISGSAGWETICGGKSVLVFGRPWYLSLPGVVRYREGVELKEIMEYKHDHSLLEKEFGNLYRKMAPGVIDPGYAGLVKDYSDEENSRLLQKFLERILGDD
ncbi:MAG: hypothetical protein GXP52_08855 [Deltaproteobacteria bacterium]|nr:hypothetical protein [Deltaproteobacteria bacterium]